MNEQKRKQAAYLALFMFAVHLNHISQHLDLEFLWGEVLHIQVDRESVLLQMHLEIVRWKGAGKRKKW